MTEDRDADSPVKVVFVVTEDWYFVSHRLGLAKACREAGYDVAVATRVAQNRDVIEAEGIRVLPIRLRRSGRNPFRELVSLWELLHIFRRERPDLLHLVAMKPVIYGGIAALAVPRAAVVSALAGLGHAFTATGLRSALRRAILRPLLRLALGRRNGWLILQNDEDAESFVGAGLIRRDRLSVVRGSGVDLARFAPSPEPEGTVIFSVVSRMLRDKGIGETVAAARELKNRGAQVRVRLVGDPDPENPTSIAAETLRRWHDQGVVEWQGQRADIPEVWRESHIALLPSYREGLPKSLIEAAACGRPIIATDVPGCREVVVDGETGLLVPARDGIALADAMETLAASPELRHRLGAAGRRRAEKLYGEAGVIAATLALYDRALGTSGSERRGAARAA